MTRPIPTIRTKPKKTRARKAKRVAKAKPATARETVLVMRTCASDMTSHGGFVWPKSGPVECKDWKPIAECGNGLHGLLWGDGDSTLLDWNESARWLVVEVGAASVVSLGGKVKFPRGVVIYCGDMKGAAKLIGERAPAGTKIVGGTATAGTRGTATAGDAGTATAGTRGTATAGDEGSISIFFYDSTGKYRRPMGFVGKGGLEPNVAYVVNDGKFVRKDSL